ncbi:hypothetical protein QW060_18060 [Myroides ceti]|uniref:Uncharacterized protein n=1 Tax=Paenimyroides ceti TaxID=395087 RepID=A0ABT8D116_9FLAO|nr:hypothetical protein [Paenimyroides ceti]MDN3708982.1 hypothetical protein [Paenimyroides ceti]
MVVPEVEVIGWRRRRRSTPGPGSPGGPPAAGGGNPPISVVKPSKHRRSGKIKNPYRTGKYGLR